MDVPDLRTREGARPQRRVPRLGSSWREVPLSSSSVLPIANVGCERVLQRRRAQRQSHVGLVMRHKYGVAADAEPTIMCVCKARSNLFPMIKACLMFVRSVCLWRQYMEGNSWCEETENAVWVPTCRMKPHMHASSTQHPPRVSAFLNAASNLLHPWRTTHRVFCGGP